MRTIIVNADALKSKRDAIMRFAQGYREAMDWMYADPRAIDMYAEKMHLDRDLIADSIKEFHPKEALQTDEMKDIAGIQRERGQAQIHRRALEQGATRRAHPDPAA